MFSVPRGSFRQLTFLVLLAACASFLVNVYTAEAQEGTPATEAKFQAAIDNLAAIQQSVETKQRAVGDLRAQLKQLPDSSEKQEVEQKIARIKNEIGGLQESFEHIVLGGINRSMLAEQPEQQINWQDEIEQISRPLLSSLKELTAKPRQIDTLRRTIERLESQLKVIDRAVDAIESFSNQSLPQAVATPMHQLLIDWKQRRDDTQRELEITRFKLTSLRTESATWRATTGEAITEFVRGRGLTLLLATAVGLLIWLASKGLLGLYWRWRYHGRHDVGITRAPLFYYSYRLATAILIVLALLAVFYVRGDVVFLTLALIALAGAALTLRQTLPRYTAEIRLLLGVGPVREQERLVLDGIPFFVESLSVYSVLRNPALEGVVRLPLHAMNALVSRPAGEEPWFACQPGDYVILADGNFARVLRQTIELVEVAVLDSVVQLRTRDFLGQNIRNLSRNGFGVASTFGIDYQHQAICLDEVPGCFREAILTRFEQAGLKDDIEDILVEFSAAGASSLDYRIYVNLNGRAAHAFFKAARLVQQACVVTCNREGWVIPFTQITVHSGHNQETAEQRPAATASGTGRA